MVQLTYNETPAIGFAGMLAEEFSQRQINTYLAEGSDIPFGDAVEVGTDPATQAVALTAIIDLIGVVVASISVEQNADGTIDYKEKTSMPVMQRGRVYVTADDAVDVGEEVVPSTGANTKWTPGTGTSVIRAYARTAAGADGDIFMIELVGP